MTDRNIQEWARLINEQMEPRDVNEARRQTSKDTSWKGVDWSDLADQDAWERDKYKPETDYEDSADSEYDVDDEETREDSTFGV